MYEPLLEDEFLRPICTGWLAKIEYEQRAKQGWSDVVEDCMHFFTGATGFMWGDEYRSKFWQADASPKFRLTIAKAFELVAIFGPTLFYEVPHRTVTPKTLPEFPIELFGDPNNPYVQAAHQRASASSAMEMSAARARAELMERWLNYTPQETPGGGLEQHAELAITDALVKGRGVLFADVYKMPGSGRTLTGLVREAPENVGIDPDYPELHKAKWIYRRCIEPVWEVERKFNLPPGSLKGKASLESAWSTGERRGDPWSQVYRQDGRTNDLMMYYKIWSKTGVGSRLAGVQLDIQEHLERVVGDYAYIAVAPNVPYPLNAPSARMRAGATDAEVRQMFQWDIPFWADDKWPCTFLDFYPHPNRPWPIPPLAPGLGELKFLNVMLSHLCNRIWSSSRDFIAVMESAVSDYRKYLENGSDLSIIPVQEIQGDINKVIKFLQQPQVNFDVWRIIDAVSEIFDRRVGLSDLMYGLNPGAASRTATDADIKRQSISVRPDHMGKKVEQWMAAASGLEAFSTRWFVTGEDVRPLMGQTGQALWEQLVMASDVESVVRQMEYTIAAGSVRRPNNERDTANLQQAMQYFFPTLAEYAGVTGNVGPINNFITKYGESAQMDVSGMLLSPPEPPEPGPSPEEEAAVREAELDLQIKQQGHVQDMTHTQQEHDQGMRHDQQEHEQKMGFERGRLKIQQQAAKAQARAKASSNGSAA